MIPNDPALMPDSIEYDESTHRLMVGTGFIEHVSPEVWRYEVRANRCSANGSAIGRRTGQRPIIGDRRQPSKLGDIQPDHWLAEYTTKLLNVLHVIGRLVALEPAQADLLDRICSGPLISSAELLEAGAIGHATGSKAGSGQDEDSEHPTLFD